MVRRPDLSHQPVDVLDLVDFGAGGAVMPLRSSWLKLMSWLKLIKRHGVSPIGPTERPTRQRTTASSVLAPLPGRDCLHIAGDPATDLTELTWLFADGDVPSIAGGCSG
jgi:hypothetical protein